MSGLSRTRAEVDAVDRAGWSSIISLFDDASLYQTWDYAETVFPKQTASRLVVRGGGEVVAAAQARVVKTPVLPAGIAYVAWGPLWRRRGEPARPERFEQAADALAEEFARRRKLVLRLAPNVTEGEGAGAVAALEGRGFRRAGRGEAYRTSLLDIARPLPQVRAGLRQKWRNCLNRAEREGLEVEEGVSQRHYARFLALYDRMRRRKHFETGVDARQWALLQEALPEAEKMRVLLVRRGGEDVAAVVISCLGRRAIYLLGATSASGLECKAGYLAQWAAIERAREAGCTLYDLGGTDPEGNPGVYRFKSRMGGLEVRHVGAFELSHSRLSDLAVRAGRALLGLRGRGQSGSSAGRRL